MDAQGYNKVGNALKEQGKTDEAIASYEQALRLNPAYAEAYNNLANALTDQGKFEQAIANYQKAIRLKPHLAEIHNNLGKALTDYGKFEEALASCREALRLKPEFAEAHNNLGNALRYLRRLDEAIASFRQALRLKPAYAVAYSNLGMTLRDHGELDEALASCQQALGLQPAYAEAHNNLGNVLHDQGKLADAVASYQQALRLKPDLAEAFNNLGNALRDQGKLAEAATNYRQALRLKPNYADAHSHLGLVLTELGNIDEAIASVQEALRLQPQHAEAMWQLARLLGGKLPEADRALLERRLAEPNLKDSDRVKLLFGLAEVCDARREYEQATVLLRQANSLALALRQQKGQGYDIDENVRFVENLRAAFTPAFFERMRGFGVETERPVFIVGLPRSGTTLTEQILAAHSQVFGAGELILAREDFQALRTQPLSALPGEALHRLAERHLEQLAALNRSATRIVDKMPENYFYLGLLAAMFPRAKFIHCRRDLRDVAVSCWMTHFEGLRWANDPDHIAAHFREYQRLMEHWRAVLPVRVLEVQYEDTVADLPGVARRLVEWCGLDWEPACLAFHESKTTVRSASVVQVRQPIHAKSVSRWRNYERALSSLFAALKPLLSS